jgi:hypothetical protein
MLHTVIVLFYIHYHLTINQAIRSNLTPFYNSTIRNQTRTKIRNNGTEQHDPDPRFSIIFWYQLQPYDHPDCALISKDPDICLLAI